MAHIDIKLENILVSDDGILKLSDFGMVESLDAKLTQQNGTLMYMAPEIANLEHSETYEGLPADIFSLGVVFWLLHFGTPPFSSATSRDRNYSVLSRNPEAFW